MMSFFLNPITMLAGAALVSAPIIIHLINRMRFRRIKWAAMEFLLKAQKRMRRKMIIEQLILLFLRCLLVFLIGLLFARFLGFDPLQGKETRPTVHVVILDDTPSMADTGRGEGASGDAFTEAKKQITDRILPAALEATTTQRVQLLRLSDQANLLAADPNKEQAPSELNTTLIEEVKGVLAKQKVATVRASLVTGLKKAHDTLNKAGTETDTAKIVHVVTDLRSIDWEQDGEALSQTIREMSEAGIKVHLIDAASPPRPQDKSRPLTYSDNVGIVEFKPRTRVAAKDDQSGVDFELRVKNFGTVDLKDVLVQFYLNGQGNQIQTQSFAHLPAGQERMQLVQVRFTQVATKEDPLARFNIVTALIPKSAGDAILTDNVRHAVIEVREKLSVLVIPGSDEDIREPNKKTTDSFYLRRLFNDAFGGVNLTVAMPDALEKHDLRQYSTIFLLNVAQLKESEVAKLEAYVRDGGGVGVFLGPKVNADSYNKLMYKDGKGFFPVRLPSKHTDPLTKEQKDKRAFSKRILVREPAAKMHPALSGIYTNERGDPIKDDEVERYFYFVNIDQYWPVERRGLRDDTRVRELYCMPNEKPVGDFLPQVTKMRDAVRLKYGEPKFQKYRDTVSRMLDEIRASAESTDTPLPILARQLDRLLADQVNDGTPEEALIREFWSQPEMNDAKVMAQSLRDETKFGDPLYFAKTFENGRVVLMTTTLGETGGTEPWNDWASGAGAAGWVAVMKEMQKYLAGGGAEENRTVGTPLSVPFEAGRYKPAYSGMFLTADTSKEDKNQAPLIRTSIAEQPLDTKDNALRLNFTDNKRPGVYIFTVTWQARDGDPKGSPSEKPEYFATVFNPDTAREGALQRAKGNDLAVQAKGAEIHAADDTGWLDTLKQKQTDLSSGRWIYLLIALVLILEQAMAVRLSYHTRPEDLEAHAPSAAAVFAHGTAPPASAEATAPATAETAT
jgi:hypothetical protein